MGVDLMQIVEIAKNKSNPLLGMSFFECQVRYDKGGSEMDFGMFGLGDKTVGQVPLGDSWERFNISCLKEVPDKASGVTMPAAVALAYGGKVPSDKLCPQKAADLVV